MLFFRYVDIRIGYAILACIIPFYLLFNRQAYLGIGIISYAGVRHGLLRHIYKNHYLFGQMMMDRFYILPVKECFTSRITDWRLLPGCSTGKEAS